MRLIKKLKFIAPLSILPSVLAISTNTENETEEKRELDKDFDTFANKQSENVKKHVSDFIDSKIKFLQEQSQYFLNPGDSGISAQNIYKSLYYSKLSQYLSTNKEAILSNYKDYGFEITYPFVLSLNKTIDQADIVYNGESYSDILIGKTDTTNYSNILSLEGNSKKVSNADLINNISEEKMNKQTQDYFNNLDTSFDTIFLNPDDRPELDKQIRIIQDKNDLTKVELSTPEGFDNWNEFFKNKISNRFIVFDLEQNMKQNQIQEEEPEQPIPPLIPDDSENEAKSYDEYIAKENIARLNPYLKHKYYSIKDNVQTLVDDFNSNPEFFTREYFYFNNPINTRFEYLVTKLTNDNGKIKAEIRIHDINNKTLSASYNADVLIWEDQNFSRTFEYGINIIKDTFNKFYLALGLDEKLDLTSLLHKVISDVVFNLTFETIRIINTTEYKQAFINLTIKYQNFSLDDLEKSNYAQELQELFLGFHKNSKINGTYYWNFLASAYKELFNNYVHYVQKNQDEFLKNNLITVFGEHGASKINEIEQALKVLNEKIDIFKSFSFKNSFSLLNEYDKILSSVQNIRSTFEDFRIITQNQLIKSTDEEVKSAFREAYWKLDLKAPNSYKKDLQIILISIVSIMILLMITLGTTTTIMFKKQVIKKRKYIIEISVIATILLISIILAITLPFI